MALKPKESEHKAKYLQFLHKQEDTSITEVLGSASHTALYRFDSNASQWERVGVEGSVFVVLADRAPVARLIVLNTIAIKNNTLDLAQVDKIKNQSPYLMLRLHATSEHKIIGLWFKKDEERTAIKELMEKAMTLSKNDAKIAKTSTQIVATGLISTKNDIVQNPENSELSLEALSQSTTAFHEKTHKNGAPIELDPSLPNNFTAKQIKVQKATVGDATVLKKNIKGQALLNSLKGTTTSVCEELPTDFDISSSNSSKKQREAKASQGAVPGSAQAVQTSLCGSNLLQGVKLFAPSDITGVRQQFLKL